MKRIFQILSEQKVILISILLVIALLLVFIAYVIKTRTYLTAEFKDLRPFHHSVPVYYKGFKIGKAENVRPNKDYTQTVMTIVLFPSDLHLPTNTLAKFKKEKGKNKEIDFVELVYPDSPSIYFLKNGDRLAGKTTVDIETYMANQDPETLDAIKDNIAKAAESLNTTLGVLGDLFIAMQNTVNENRPNLLKASGNLEEISENLRDSTSKLNNALEENKLQNTVTNVDLTSGNAQETSKNLQEISKDVSKMTKNIDKMLPQIDCIIDETYSITKNVNDITSGVSCAMQQKFGGMRLLFGKTIKCPRCKKMCN